MYIIAGPNGAGKTTLSFTILPEIFDCDEFINADEIARGLSPLNPDKANLRAGRLMLGRMKELIAKGDSFAFETTLATRSYQSFIKKAIHAGYDVTLLFLMLDTVELAIQRVERRVFEGGHDIPLQTIERRFTSGLMNFFQLYLPIVSRWMLVNNSTDTFASIAKGYGTYTDVVDKKMWEFLKNKYHG